MKKYIFGDPAADLHHDLEKTAECIEQARSFARDIAAKAASSMFIGTKSRPQDVVKEES